jgi:hypothetical protein
VWRTLALGATIGGMIIDLDGGSDATECWQDFEIYQGDKVTLHITVRDKNGDPLDLSAPAPTAITWAVSGSAGGAAAISKSLAAATISIVSAANGIIGIDVLPADVAALAAGCYHHELKLTAPDPHTAITGEMRVRRATLTG